MKNKDSLNVLIPEIGEVVALENSALPNRLKVFPSVISEIGKTFCNLYS